VKTKTNSVFGTQAQQDAAWLKATGAKSLPSAVELARRRSITKEEIKWVRSYQNACYDFQFGSAK
jgi:hypothetical protein